MMKFLKRHFIYLFAAALLLAVLLPGYSLSQSYAENTVEITDMLGRTVMIPETPQRLAMLDPFAGYAVVMLGQGDKMVGTVGGVKRDVLLQEILPSLEHVAVVKEEGAVNAEALLKLKVDLIFIKAEDYEKKAEREKLDTLDIPYLVIGYQSMEEQCAAMRLIGQVFGAQKEAETYVDYYRDTVRRVSDIVGNIPAAKKPTLYHSVNSAVFTDGKESVGAEWIAVTGAKNVSLDGSLSFGGTEYEVTLEQIYQWEPDVIICNESSVPEYILMSGRWQGLGAVREGRVYQIPIGISRMGHFNSVEIPLAIWWLADLLYPEYFADFDFREELRVFYTQFFDYELDEATIDSILSGQGIRASGVGVSKE